MSSTRQINNLALIGFMGTGKSSVGQLVAAALHFTFLDTDQLIESRVGKTIPEIFTQDGEPAFRQLEAQVVLELESRTKHLISTGGGLPTNPANLASLKSHSLVVCLWASPEKIWERIRHQTHRPLLHDPDPLARITSLLTARDPFYRQADVLINTELRPVKEVAQQIVHQYHIAQAAHR
ncbi:MAG: shikimate kinase [Akkermansiaceae bacterium]|nr:shikimate kinase [Verrucomicrobiales bacterium]